METNRESLGSLGRTEETMENFVTPGDIGSSKDAAVAAVIVGEDGVLVVPNIEPPADAGKAGVAKGEAKAKVEYFVAPGDIEPSTDAGVASVTVAEDGVLVVPNIEPPAKMR